MTTLPYVTINILSASTKEQNETQKVLFVGQMTSSGSATSGTLYENIGNSNEQDALFGKTSMLANMIKSFKNINVISRVDAIPLSDAGAGVKATCTIAFSGTATETGTITVAVGSKLNHLYSLDVTSGLTATQIGDLLVAAIVADDRSPVTAVNTTGSVVLSYVHKGLEGNFITSKVDGTISGITYTNGGFTGGLTNPTLTTLFDVVGSNRYQTVVYPTTYTISILTDFLDPRFNAEKNILDGIGIITLTDTAANLVSDIETENSQSLVIIGNKEVDDSYYKGGAIVEIDYIVSSQFAAIRALRLSPDADISRYVNATYGLNDSFGGAHIASLPYFNTPFYNLPVEETGKGFTDSEITALNTAGVSVLNNNSSKTRLIAGQLLTTYKTDSSDNADVSFKYLEYVDTSSNIREYFYNNLKARFAQSRLTEGDVQPNVNMANANVIKSYLDGLYNDLSGSDYVLTQAGETARTFFSANRTVTLDLSVGKVTVAMIVPIVTQLREILISMQISFSTNG